MHRPFAPVAYLALILLLAACQSSASQSPAGANGGESSAAAEPGASQPAGNGGSSGGEDGSAQYEISGDYTDSGELRFIPEASYFDQNGSTYLSFTNEGESTVLFIAFGENQGNAVSFGNEEASVVQGADACTINLTQDDATGAAGTFDCTNASIILAGSEQLGTGTISGSFEAHL
jgi:hypothetical protein